MIINMNFCFEYQVSFLWPRHLSTESTRNVMMYSRKNMTHHQSQGDANHLVHWNTDFTIRALLVMTPAHLWPRPGFSFQCPNSHCHSRRETIERTYDSTEIFFGWDNLRPANCYTNGSDWLVDGHVWWQEFCMPFLCKWVWLSSEYFDRI
jgi:hypothetical protein